MYNYYREGCNGCEISRGNNESVSKMGGIIELGSHWILDHYGGGEGFLGWMILQPTYHRKDLGELTVIEASTMGLHIQDVNNALQKYWQRVFPDDPIKRMYIVHFHEGVFGNVDGNEPADDWHFHIHLIPRTKRIGSLLRTYDPAGGIRAWSMPEVSRHPDFPVQYKLDNKKQVCDLVGFLRSALW